jgi:hypothetical protein
MVTGGAEYIGSVFSEEILVPESVTQPNYI